MINWMIKHKYRKMQNDNTIKEYQKRDRYLAIQFTGENFKAVKDLCGAYNVDFFSFNKDGVPEKVMIQKKKGPYDSLDAKIETAQIGDYFVSWSTQTVGIFSAEYFHKEWEEVEIKTN